MFIRLNFDRIFLVLTLLSSTSISFDTFLLFKLTEGKSDIIQPPALYLTGSREWTQEYIESIGFDMQNKRRSHLVNKNWK